jgi:ribonucleoside-diphosphate reductase alpha chain
VQESVSVSDVTLNMMKKRVLFKKRNGEQETPQDAYKRVAKFIATGHAKFSPNEVKRFEAKTLEMLSESRFMPNTPTLVNAGFPNAQCSACFVLPIKDELRSIYKAHNDQGLIQASGGGTGFYLGHIRPNGTTASHGRFATKGPVSWLKMFNENAGHVVQGMRDGANMAMLDVGHPDIVEFITCKSAGYGLQIEALAEQFNVSMEEATRIRSVIGIEKFNVSVSIPDIFMRALEKGEDWYFVDPHTKQRTKSMPAKELWDLIIKNAHEHGEPGVFFIDEANRYNKIPHVGRIECTNPCGEQPLNAYESCTLGHINLSKYVAGTNGTSQVDWNGLEEVIRFGVQFLDDVVEINTFPIPELAEMNRGTRRIGLGVMGWADMLVRMGLKYDSDLAIKRAHEVGEFFDKISLDESQKLGVDRGNFPYFEGSYWHQNGFKNMRNSDRTTVAPTGQTSMYAGCSSGIEPIYAPVTRREQAGMVQVDYHPILFSMLNEKGLDTQEIKDKLGVLGSVRAASFIPDDIKELFPSAHDVHHSWHVKHQAAWQKHITSAVSKTINLPKDATPSDVSTAYLEAYKNGCKGITVYRDGSRLNQPLSSTKEKEGKKLVQLKHKRSEVTHGTNRKVPTGCGNLMVYVGESEGHIEELTARLGKGGGCAAAQTEAIARMASIAMQHGAAPEYIAKQLSGVRCHLSVFHRSKYTGDHPRTVTSCADAMSVALSEHLLNGSGKKLDVPDKLSGHTGACPDCGGQLAFEEGCHKCYACGFSRCM